MANKKGQKLIIIFLLLVIFSGISAAEEKVLRSSWYILEKDEKPVGFNFSQFFEITDGYRYITDQTVKMNFLGNPVDVTFHMDIKVDQKYGLQSFKISSKTNKIQTKIAAECNDGEINVVYSDENGNEQKSYFKIEEELYITDSALDYLFTTKDIEVGQEYIMTCWNIVENEPQKTTISIEEAIVDEYNGKTFSGYKIRITDKSTDSLIIVDNLGEIYTFNDFTNITMQKVEKENIPQLQSMAMDVLLVPGNLKITHPFRSIDSHIRVKWRDVDHEEFDWEDNRQELVQNDQSIEGHEVLVKIHRDDRDFTNKIKLPIEEAKFDPYLKDTDFIHPSLPEIKKLVPEILGETNDGWLATQKLVSWVYEFIKNEAIIETLSTEEILTRQSGKCVEYAVLFASLARSAGLPTRLVLGERYEANNWFGHMWNEVWLGEWISVDPSHNQASPDALLLKFVHSNTVMGTQAVRKGLIGKLDIEIIDVQLSQAMTDDGEVLETGIDGQTYTNADFPCQITAPEGWQLIETEEQGIPLLVMQPTDAIAQAVLIMLSVPEGTTSEQMLETRITALKNVLPGFTLIEQESKLLTNKPAAYGTWTVDIEEGLVRQQNWVLTHRDLCYILVFGVADDLWEDYQSYFQEILASFQTKD